MQVDKEMGREMENVVSLFGKRSEKKEETAKTVTAEAAEDFNMVMKKNQEVAQRMKKEREKANRSVLRSYRIKN